MFFCQSDYCSSDRRLLPGAENSVAYRLDRDKAMSRDSIKGFSETTEFFWPLPLPENACARLVLSAGLDGSERKKEIPTKHVASGRVSNCHGTLLAL